MPLKPSRRTAPARLLKYDVAPPGEVHNLRRTLLRKLAIQLGRQSSGSAGQAASDAASANQKARPQPGS
jgi:hypothetical protein